MKIYRENYLKYIINIIIILFCLTGIDLTFKQFAFNEILDGSIFRLLGFNLALSLSLSLFACLTKKMWRIIIPLFLFGLGFYAFLQLNYYNYMGNYLSIKATFDGAGRVVSELSDFILAIDIKTLIIFIFPLVSTILLNYNRSLKTNKNYVVVSVLVILILNIQVWFFLPDYGVNSIKKIYDYPSPAELALKELGPNRFLQRDILTIFKEVETQIYEEEKNEVKEDNPYIRNIDDSNWIELIANEENESIKLIDEYLIDRSISDYNDMTGYFEGKNFIYIMVEAFDYMAIDENITPTLYKMYNEGISFQNYYTPKYSCTTAESEFIGLMSLIPSNDVCTPNTYIDNIYPQSIYSLFSNIDYQTLGFHNWTDEFYERNYFHLNYGADDYFDIDELEFSPLVSGWQSDIELIEKSLPYYIDEEKFMSFIITSATHFPYDQSSEIGDKYLDIVNEYYPDDPVHINRYRSKAIEVDKALELLLDSLEQSGELDNTVIAVFSDHHPLNTSLDDIVTYTNVIDRSYGFNIDRTPAFIYNSEIDNPIIVDEVMSTFDLLPTIANLFNLEFDPRYYFGVDIFSDEESLVIFTNKDWVNNVGYYTANSNEFTPFNEEIKLSEQEIEAINIKVSNAINISLQIYETDYFSKRNFEVKYIK